MNKPFSGWVAGEPLPDLPHSLDAEQALLGTLVAIDVAVTSIADLLRPEDFYEAAHFHLFSTISGMMARGETMSIVSLVSLLRTDPALKPLDNDLPGGWK